MNYEERERFYKSKEWVSLRNHARNKYGGVCNSCGKLLQKVPRTYRGKTIYVYEGIVDHVIPITEDWELRLDISNLQLLCWSCHNYKTFKSQSYLDEVNEIDYAKRELVFKCKLKGNSN